MQQDYVTKKEFGEFRSEVNDRFDGVDSRFDAVDKRFDESKSDTERYMGILREGFKDDLRVTNDWVASITEKVNVLAQKVGDIDVKFENRFLRLDVKFDLFEEKVNERFNKLDGKVDKLSGQIGILLKRSAKKVSSYRELR